MLSYKHEIGDTVWLMLMQGLTYLAPLLVWPYLMATLGAEKFGYIGFSQSVMLFLMQLVDFGFNFSVTKKIAQAKDNQTAVNRIASATLLARVYLLGIGALILGIVLCVPRFAVYRSVLMIMFLMVVANAFSFVWLFQGLGKIRIVSIVTSLCKLTILPLTFFFVHSGNDVTIAAALQAAVYVVASLITFGFIVGKKYVTQWSLHIEKSEIKEIFSSSFNIFLSGMATMFYTTFFVIILGYIAAPDVVGKYTAAEKLVRMACYFVFTPLAQSFFPKVSAMAPQYPQKCVQLINKLLIVCLLLMSAIGIAFLLGADLIVDLLHRQEYIGTEKLIRIMAFLPLIVSIGGISGQLGLLALGDEKSKLYYRNVYFIAVAIGLPCLCLLTPLFAVKGVALSLMVSETFICLAMYIAYKKLTKESLNKVQD